MSTDEPMRPKRSIPRSAPPRRRNPARRNREWTRAYHSDERVAFVAALPCVVCGYGPCENAHWKGGGAGRKADASAILPLCKLHHAEQHQLGVSTFGGRHGLDLAALAAETERAFRAFCGDEP